MPRNRRQLQRWIKQERSSNTIVPKIFTRRSFFMRSHVPVIIVPQRCRHALIRRLIQRRSPLMRSNIDMEAGLFTEALVRAGKAHILVLRTIRTKHTGKVSAQRLSRERAHLHIRLRQLQLQCHTAPCLEAELRYRGILPFILMLHCPLTRSI